MVKDTQRAGQGRKPDRIVKNMDSGFKSSLCLLLAVCLWTSLLSLSVSQFHHLWNGYSSSVYSHKVVMVKISKALRMVPGIWSALTTMSYYNYQYRPSKAEVESSWQTELQTQDSQNFVIMSPEWVPDWVVLESRSFPHLWFFMAGLHQGQQTTICRWNPYFHLLL